MGGKERWASTGRVCSPRPNIRDLPRRARAAIFGAAVYFWQHVNRYTKTRRRTLPAEIQRPGRRKQSALRPTGSEPRTSYHRQQTASFAVRRMFQSLPRLSRVMMEVTTKIRRLRRLSYRALEAEERVTVSLE